MHRGVVLALFLTLVVLPAALVWAWVNSDGVPTGHYEWHELKARPALARTEVAGAAVGTDIYVIGGFVPPSRTTAAVERFDTVHRRWRRVRPLPVPLNHAAAVGYRGFVYVVGGYASPDGLAKPVRSLYRYDPKRNHWKRLADMAHPRAALAVGATGGRIYAAGGSDGARQTAALEVYSIRRNRWSRGPAMSVAREHLGGAAAGGEFYAVAGRNGADGNLAITEMYSARTKRWTRLPDMPKARGGNGAAAYVNGLVAIGGEEAGGTIGEVDLFNWITRKWEQIEGMPTARHGLAVATTTQATELWTIAGGPQPGMAFSKNVELLTHELPAD